MPADQHAQHRGHADLGGGQRPDEQWIWADFGEPPWPDRAARPPGEQAEQQPREQPDAESGEHLRGAARVGDAGQAHPLPRHDGGDEADENGHE